jgi:hypothetical protein
MEAVESARLADELMQSRPHHRRRPRRSPDRPLVRNWCKKMGWDQVVQHKMLPLLERVTHNRNND